MLGYGTSLHRAAWRIGYFNWCLIVLASLSGLSILIAHNWFPSRSSMPKMANDELSPLENAFSQFQSDTARFPTTSEGFNALMNPFNRRI